MQHQAASKDQRALTYETTQKDGALERQLLAAWFENTSFVSKEATTDHIRSSIASSAKADTRFKTMSINSITMGNRMINTFLKSQMAEGARQVRKNADGTWFIGPTASSSKANRHQKQIDDRKLKRLEADRAKLQALLKEAEEADVAKVAAAAPAVSKQPLLNSTVAHSLRFKQLLREAFLIDPSLSETKAPQLFDTIVWAYLAEMLDQGHIKMAPGMDEDGLMDEVVRNTPCKGSLASYIETCSSIDDFYLEAELGKLVVVYSCIDGGNKQGRKFEFQLEAGWDPALRRIVQRTTDMTESGGDGKAHADAVDTTQARLGLLREAVHHVGSCTDSASDVLKGYVEEERKKNKSFVGVGCMLHIMNLILMNAYHMAFGEEKMGTPSALRTSYMVSYLIDKFYDDFAKYCDDNNRVDMKHHVAQGSKNRWWSVTQAFGDILHDPQFYSDFMMDQANRLKTTSTYTPLFKEVAGWLANTKVLADLTFVQTFCSYFWNDAMLFLQDRARWMAEESLEEQYQLSGYRADEMTRFVVQTHRKLRAIQPRNMVEFDSWRSLVDQLGEAEEGGVQMSAVEYKELALKQGDGFMNEAVRVAEHHFLPWLTDRVDTGLADVPEVALPLARSLLSIFDGKPQPLIDPAEEIEIDGESLNLAELIADMTQFATADGLRKQSVFFMQQHDEVDVVSMIRSWAESGEMCQALRLRLEAYIRPMLISSHCAERSVQQGGLMVHRYAGHQRESQIASKMVARANLTLEEVKAAYAEYKESPDIKRTELLRRDESKSWRRAGKAPRRTAGRTQNKFMRRRLLALLVKRAARVSTEVMVAVKERAKAVKAEGHDRDAVAKRRKCEDAAAKDATKTATLASSTRTTFDPAARAEIAANSNGTIPISVLGMINLDAEGKSKGAGDLQAQTGDPKASKEDLAVQIELRLGPTAAKAAGLKRALTGASKGQVSAAVTKEALINILADIPGCVEMGTGVRQGKRLIKRLRPNDRQSLYRNSSPLPIDLAPPPPPTTTTPAPTPAPTPTQVPIAPVPGPTPSPTHHDTPLATAMDRCMRV